MWRWHAPRCRHQTFVMLAYKPEWSQVPVCVGPGTREHFLCACINMHRCNPRAGEPRAIDVYRYVNMYIYVQDYVGTIFYTHMVHILYTVQHPRPGPRSVAIATLSRGPVRSAGPPTRAGFMRQIAIARVNSHAELFRPLYLQVSFPRPGPLITARARYHLPAQGVDGHRGVCHVH